MKRCILLCFFMIFNLESSFCQSWDLIQTKRTSFYKKPDGQYFVIDWSNKLPVPAEIPPRYKPYSVFWNESSYVNDTSWIGSLAVKKTNGDQIFVTCKGDSLLIKTQASLNDIWAFDTNYNATITGIISSTILGLQDSVKIIKIRSINSNDSLEIRISKNYGFVTTPVLKYFPYNLGDFNLTLSGIQGLAGFQNLSDSVFYNFNVGDEFETVYNNYYIFCTGGKSGGTTIFTLNKIIQKIDSVNYKVKTYTYTVNYCDGLGNSYSLDSTSSSDLSFSSSFTALSNNPVSSFKTMRANKLPSSGFGYNVSYNLNFNYLNVILTDSSKEFSSQNNVFGSLKLTFIKGIGNTYYFSQQDDSQPYYKREYLYYKFGNKTFGQRPDYSLSITGINDQLLEGAEITIAPNPFSEKIIINATEITKDLDLIITDLNGKVVINERLNLSQSPYVVNRRNLLPGIYFYKISDNKGLIKTGKLVAL